MGIVFALLIIMAFRIGMGEADFQAYGWRFRFLIGRRPSAAVGTRSTPAPAAAVLPAQASICSTTVPSGVRQAAKSGPPKPLPASTDMA